MDTDDLPPVDLESICASYAPSAAMARLLFIADKARDRSAVSQSGETHNAGSQNNNDQVVFQTLELDALKLAHDILKRGENMTTYVEVCTRIAGTDAGAAGTDAGAQYTINQTLVDQKEQNSHQKREILQTELAGYKTNSIKESIRMGYCDLGDFYRARGDYQNAFKAYARTRDYCTTARHVVSTCLNVARVGVESENYAHVQNYCAKAASAVSSAGVSTQVSTNGTIVSTGVSTPRATVPLAPPPSSAADPQALAELARAAGLAHLEARKYRDAARKFSEAASLGSAGEGAQEEASTAVGGTAVGGTAIGGTAVGANSDEPLAEILSSKDVATYGVLCALCSCDSGEIKRMLSDDVAFRSALEGTPEVRELSELFISHKFAEALLVLNQVTEKLQFDYHLYDHLVGMTKSIREKALALYCAPFSVADLNAMAGSFNVDIAELEKELIGLIQEDKISARIDSKNKTLHAKIVDARSNAINAVKLAGKEFIAGTKAVLCRASLLEHGLVVGGTNGERRRTLGMRSDRDSRHGLPEFGSKFGGMGMGMGRESRRDDRGMRDTGSRRSHGGGGSRFLGEDMDHD